MASKKKTTPKADACELNPDPITGQTGSHPGGVGIGAASGGATGMAIGAADGPVGMAVGAVAGAVVGGLIGKGINERIDPTCDDHLETRFAGRPYVKKGETFETYRPAYQYGGLAESRYPGRPFADIEPDLRADWESAHAGKTGMPWDRVRPAVQDAFDRTIQLREERLKAHEVPVEREEVVIERHPASGMAKSGDIREEILRIPVKEDQVHVSKEAVVTEEVSIGKRKVRDTEHISDTVRKETLKFDESGGAKVHDRSSRPKK